jgi:hypothetical protein
MRPEMLTLSRKAYDWKATFCLSQSTGWSVDWLESAEVAMLSVQGDLTWEKVQHGHSTPAIPVATSLVITYR